MLRNPVRVPTLLCLCSLTLAAAAQRDLAALKNPNPLIRESAAKSFGAAHNRRAVPPLIATLRDSNVHVRQAAATALGEIRDPRAIQPLIASLQGPSSGGCQISSSQEVVAALTHIGWPAVPALTETLNDPQAGSSNSIAWAVVKALGGIHDPRLTGLLLGLAQNDPNPKVREHALEALALLKDPRSVPTLISILEAPPAPPAPETGPPRKKETSFSRALADPTMPLRVRALNALDAIGTPEAIAAVTTARTSPNEFVRGNATRHLAEHSTPTLATLTPALSSDNGDIRYPALAALAHVHDPQALPILRAALQSQEERIRYAAVLGLGGQLEISPNPEALDLLFSVQNDPGSRVRSAFIKSVVDIQSPRAIPAVIAAVTDSAETVRREAVIVLDQIPPTELTPQTGSQRVAALVDALKDRSSSVRVAALHALVKLKSPQAVPSLLAALHDPSEDFRWPAADDLAQIGDPAAIDPLLQALQSERKPAVRQHIISALIRFNDPRAIDPIVTLLQQTTSRDDLFRTPSALGESKNPLATAALVRLLQDQRPETRVAGASGLAVRQAQQDPSAVGPLTTALSDSVAEVREEAAIALINITDRSTVPALLAALHDSSWQVRNGAAYALVHTGDPRAIPALIETFATEEPGATNSGAAALGESSDPAALTAIIGALDSPNPHVRLIAAQVLHYRNDPKTFPALIRAEHDTDPAVRQAAELALSGCPRPMPMD